MAGDTVDRHVILDLFEPMVAPVIDIPKKPLFKASEVCEIAQVQAYVLRSWEIEFQDLGVTKGIGRARVYRRTDVERVLKIKDLLFVEGLTLGAARRRLEEEDDTQAPWNELTANESLLKGVTKSLCEVKEGLRSILELLSVDGDGTEVERKLRGQKMSKAKKAGTVRPGSN